MGKAHRLTFELCRQKGTQTGSPACDKQTDRRTSRQTGRCNSMIAYGVRAVQGWAQLACRAMRPPYSCKLSRLRSHFVTAISCVPAATAKTALYPLHCVKPTQHELGFDTCDTHAMSYQQASKLDPKQVIDVLILAQILGQCKQFSEHRKCAAGVWTAATKCFLACNTALQATIKSKPGELPLRRAGCALSRQPIAQRTARHH